MKKIRISITSTPTSTPIKITISMDHNDYSNVELFIPLVDGQPTVASKKQWYVYFYFRNPDTKLMERFIPFNL